MCVLFFCVTLWEIERTLAMRLGLWDSPGRFFSHRTHRFNRTLLRTVSNPQKASGIQNSQNVIAKGGCKVLWLLPPARALWNAVHSVHLCLSVRKKMFESRWRRLFSHRTHRFNGAFWHTFRVHRTPPAYREHRALQLMLAVRFCEFCRPQGLCEILCVLFICVILWEKVRTLAMRWHPSKSLGCIISHRTHRFNRAFLAHAFVHWKFFLSQSTQSSRSFLAHVSSPQKAFGIQRTQRPFN